jgi:hypothetical protein
VVVLVVGIFIGVMEMRIILMVVVVVVVVRRRIR